MGNAHQHWQMMSARDPNTGELAGDTLAFDRDSSGFLRGALVEYHDSPTGIKTRCPLVDGIVISAGVVRS